MSSTIKDVARYAGVSTATVSRVINNDPNVKPQNAEKVREAIKACNFVPNFVSMINLFFFFKRQSAQFIAAQTYF